jgi:hypothetical protein
MGLNRFENKIKRVLLYVVRTFSSTYKKNRNKKIVFILSTGRCGSTSITDMFNQNAEFKAFHEDISHLVALSTDLAHKELSDKEIESKFKGILRNKLWDAGSNQVIVHSDHRLWNFVGFLADYFPNSYFIHLIRNPFDSVNSFMPRNWYSDEEIDSIYEKYRLKGNYSGEFSNEEWNALSRLEKCTWYWNYVNENINKQLGHIDNSRHTLIKLEEGISHQMNKIIKLKFNLDRAFLFSEKIANTRKDNALNKYDSFVIEDALNKVGNYTYLKYYLRFKK